MLRKVGDHIVGCLERAAAAEQRAARTTDPELKAHHFAMAKQWSFLARSYEFAESLERFLLDSERNTNGLPPEPPLIQ
jgi:hypothetical protein